MSESELGQFIPFHYHHNMLRDVARMSAFREAIEKLVKPGAKVVELGGGTGVLSYFAAKNAAKVWYVEYNPELFELGKRTIALNGGANKIECVLGDAASFTPPEPVDVVICEMLHVGFFREKQLSVIAEFKRRYVEKFGPKLPRFIPEASFLALQPMQQSFKFSDYYCPIPIFHDAAIVDPESKALGDPLKYAAVDYRSDFSQEISWSGMLPITASGELSALKLIMKNVVGVFIEEKRTADWYMAHMIYPLATALAVKAGETVEVAFSYSAGGRFEEFGRSLRVNKVIV